MTEIGVAGEGPVVDVGGAGTLALVGRAPFFDWWVGADDRWHHASTEPAVRQRIAADGATLETRLRVPGGDVVQRLAAVPDHGSTAVVVELENDSPVPVAITVVLTVDRADVEVVGQEIRSAGRTLLRVGRAIARTYVADDDAGARAGVASGVAFPPIEGTWPEPGKVVVAIVPLPHTASVRISVAPPQSSPTPPGSDVSAVDTFPPFDAVARGWELHLGRGARVSVPDDRVACAEAAARRHLLIGSAQPITGPFWTVETPPWTPAVAAVALEAWGHTIEARELLLAASGVDDLTVHAARGTAEAGALLWAWAERLERRADPELDGILAPWVEQVATGLMRRPRRFGRNRATPGDDAWRAVGLAAAGSLLSRLGDDAVGPDIVDALPALIGELDESTAALGLALGANRLGSQLPGLGPALERHFGLRGHPDPIVAMLAATSESGALAWGERTQHPAMSALFLIAFARALVSEPAGAGGPIALLPSPVASWLGSPLEAHDLPVTSGSASFGVRWHAARPALLWDITGPAGRSVCAPGLDSDWSEERARGEALLPPTPSLAVDHGPESPQVRRGKVLGADDEPESFA